MKHGECMHDKSNEGLIVHHVVCYLHQAFFGGCRMNADERENKQQAKTYVMLNWHISCTATTFFVQFFCEPIHYCVFLHLNLFVLHFICPSIYSFERPSIHLTSFPYTHKLSAVWHLLHDMLR